MSDEAGDAFSDLSSLIAANKLFICGLKCNRYANFSHRSLWLFMGKFSFYFVSHPDIEINCGEERRGRQGDRKWKADFT